MSEPAELRVTDALDKLIHQFADPLSFYREVIQNALDAGSEEIEIYLTHEEGQDGKPGVTIIHIDDWGVGMTREIIEKRLTRLFSSSKDGDRTKIGKFGIGFVSIFATKPELVCIDTSREGEHWRVLFTEDRKFELRRLDHPIDGTKIRIYKRTTREEHESLIDRSRRTIRFWCKHTHGDVRFQDEPITEPFDLAAPVRIHQEDEASSYVVGHPIDGSSFFGLYNRGLTLLEGNDEHHPGVHFKVSSDLLEHTLTRDNVIHDEGYDRVFVRVQELIRGPLAEAVFKALAEAIENDDGSTDREHLRYLYRAGAWHLRAGAIADRDLDTTVAFSPAGALISLTALRKALTSDDRPLLASRRTPLTDAVEEQGTMVLLAPSGAPLHTLVEGFGGGPLARVGARFCQPRPPSDELEAESWRPLATAVEGLLRDHGGKLSGVAIGHFEDPEGHIDDWVAITQRRFGELDEVQDVRTLGAGFLSRKRTLVLNADHPTVHALVALAQNEPEMAAYVLSKLFFLGDKLDTTIDGELAQLALERRDLRLQPA